MKCFLCGREGEDRYFEKHHLTPASMRKGSQVVILDHQCHDFIHQNFENHLLKNDYSTVEALLATDKVKTWIGWAKKQPLDKRITMSKKKRR